MSCADTIWWIPTPVENTQLSICPAARICLFISVTTLCADILVRVTCTLFSPSPLSLVFIFSVGKNGTFTGKSFSNVFLCFSHSFVIVTEFSGSSALAFCNASFMVFRNCFPVEWTKKVGFTCFDFSVTRISTWMTPPRYSAAAFLASGMKSPRRPVIRSSNLDPMQMSMSASCVIKLGVGCPCIPTMLSARSSRSSKHPRPWRVVATGICKSSANCFSSSGQSLHPCPAMMRGFLAFLIKPRIFLTNLDPTANSSLTSSSESASRAYTVLDGLWSKLNNSSSSFKSVPRMGTMRLLSLVKSKRMPFSG
mmetsp:Transcript_14299/g.21656  ORF Transcript_14299/g.21656 Transcript_14299/m.21656 type:complete len:309 (-) Transcript_14299:1597-2523(-)